jgi:NAD(P)H dehydrogenase (quinone)
MHCFIVYAHPSNDSFTRHVRDSFLRGLEQGGHTFEVSDLYKMNFKTDMNEIEYLREANYDITTPIASDVIEEHIKINKSDAIVFIYPVFWTEAPAKLVGWFDRVWTYGFAYGNRTMKNLNKALVICIAGHTLEHLKETGQYDSMKTIMLGDRIYDRAKAKEMIVLDGTTKFKEELRNANWDKHLQTAFEAGKCM